MEQIEQAAGATAKLKSVRGRKIYVQLRIPKVRAEIAELVAQKKVLVAGGDKPSKEAVENKIYCNEHLATLRKELEGLEQEKKSVLTQLREIKGKPQSKEIKGKQQKKAG